MLKDEHIHIHRDSHVDHGIPACVRDYVLRLFKGRAEFFVETVEYPQEHPVWHSLSNWMADHNSPAYYQKLPPVPCALHMDVPEGEVHYARRGDREWESRLCKRPPRMVRQVTIVAGPHPADRDAGMVVFTMYGGPEAPREPGDPSLEGEALEEAKRFWAAAALSE